MGILESIFTNIIWELLLVAAVGVAAFWARMKEHRFYKPFFGALGAMALMATLLIAVNVQFQMYREKSNDTTSENVQSRVRGWLDNFNMSVQNQSNQSAGSFFHYSVTLPSKQLVNIIRTKDKPQYLAFATRLVPTESDRAALALLSPSAAGRLEQEIGLVLAQAKMAFSVEPGIKQISFERMILISRELSELDVMTAIQELEVTMAAVSATVKMALISG